jgi:hypothetical protein
MLSTVAACDLVADFTARTQLHSFRVLASSLFHRGSQPDGSCFIGQCPNRAWSGGSHSRVPSFSVSAVSECCAQRSTKRCSSPQRCCGFGSLRRSIIVSLSSFIVVSQQAVRSDHPKAGAFGFPRRLRRGGTTTAALGNQRVEVTP